MEPTPLRVELKERRFLHVGKPPHWQGDQLGRRGSLETQRRTQQPAGRMERPAQMVRPSPLRPSLRHVSTGAHRGWKADLGRGLPLAATRQPEVAGVRSSATENTHRGSRDHHTSEAPLLSDVPRVGPPLSLSPEWRPYLPRHLEGLQPGQALTPLPAGVGSCALRQTWEQGPEGDPHAEVELKPRLSLRGYATKGEEL